MSITQEYDSDYDPPALVVHVEIIHPTNGTKLLRKGKIDTGADGTVIPIEAMSKLRLQQVSEAILGDYKGDKSTTATYFVIIRVDGVEEFVEVVAFDRETVLIGRDVLNSCKLVADGKNKVFSIEDP